MAQIAHARSHVSALFPSLIFLWAFALVPAASHAQTPLRGRVVDESGAAVARVPVTLLDRDGSALTTVITDRDGAFVFAHTCDRCHARAVLAGFGTASVTLSTGLDALMTLSPAPVHESVIVTATRDAAPTSQVGASVTVFDQAAIRRRGAALVGDLLRDAPGATVVQSGGQGNATSLFVRGGENSYTKVLLDGIPLNEPGGTFNFGGLSTGHLDRVEFVRGAQSALFGSDAMAGVLHLITARGRMDARPTVSGEMAAGGYGSWRGAGTLSGGIGRFDYSLHGGRYETDNRAPNNQFDSTTVSLSAGGVVASSLTLRVVGRYEDGRAGAPGQTAFGRPDLDAFFRQAHLVGGVTLEHAVSPRLSQRFTYALATSNQRSTNLQFDAPYTPAYKDRTSPFEFFDFTYDSGSHFRRHQASYQADLRLTHAGLLAGAEFLTVAVDWDGERGTLRDYLTPTSTSPRRNNVGATLQHQHLGRWLALTTGIRVEHNDSFGTAIVPRLSAAVFVRTRSGVFGSTRLKANAGRGIKEPTLRQSFSLSPFDLGNPRLEAEHSRTIDAGVEQRLFDDRAKLEVVWFDNRFERQISTRTISFAPYQAQYVNVGLTKARGAEVVADVAPTTGLRLSANYTFTASTIVDASSEFSDVLASGQWALRRPRHRAQMSTQWDRGPLSLGLAGTFVGKHSDSDFSSLAPALTTAGGYSLWRIQAQWQVSPRATAYARVENLTDVEYMEPLGYPAWRRTLHAGVRFRF